MVEYLQVTSQNTSFFIQAVLCVVVFNGTVTQSLINQLIYNLTHIKMCIQMTDQALLPQC